MTKDNNLEIGLDRLRLANVEVVGVDFEKFKVMNGEFTKGKGIGVVDMKTSETIQVNDFYVNVEGFGTDKDNYALQLQLYKLKGKDDYTFTLGVNAPKLYSVTNVKNVCVETEVKNIPNLIQKHLEKVGVYVDLVQATVSYFEVNYNIYGEKFDNTFRLINECWKMDNNKVFGVDTKKGYESLKLKLPTREIKAYNKGKHLKDTKQCVNVDDVARIEVSTSHKTTIRRLFGDDRLITICNNIDKMQYFYQRAIKYSVKVPYISYKDNLLEYMVKELESGVKPFELQYRLAVTNRLVDVELFAKAIKIYYKKVGKKSPNNVIKSNVNRLQKVDMELYNRLQNNCNKIEKFLDDIGL